MARDRIGPHRWIDNYEDLVDRFILLAMLYDKSGETNRGIEALLEAKAIARARRFRFVANDLLDELKKKATTTSRRSRACRTRNPR